MFPKSCNRSLQPWCKAVVLKPFLRESPRQPTFLLYPLCYLNRSKIWSTWEPVSEPLIYRNQQFTSGILNRANYNLLLLKILIVNKVWTLAELDYKSGIIAWDWLRSFVLYRNVTICIYIYLKYLLNMLFILHILNIAKRHKNTPTIGLHKSARGVKKVGLHIKLSPIELGNKAV